MFIILDKMCQYDISQYQTLSEDFIREFKDKVDWIKMSEHKKISGSFIREFQNKVI